VWSIAGKAPVRHGGVRDTTHGAEVKLPGGAEVHSPAQFPDRVSVSWSAAFFALSFPQFVVIKAQC
jgi:hypothetical protein